MNASGFFWRPVPKKHKLSPEDLKKRQAFVTKYGHHGADWWEKALGLVLDGVTLTMAPQPLKDREKHAAQAIKHMWVRKGESLDNDLHTYNRYGPQLGVKVPLWGGFSGNGVFSMKLLTDQAKLNKELWADHAHLPGRASVLFSPCNYFSYRHQLFAIAITIVSASSSECIMREWVP